jgi:hypothetical protein
MFRPAAFATFALATALLGSAAAAQPLNCPPGHAKKGWCEPGPGQRYAVVDRDVFLIADATREVVEAFGALDRLLPD